MLSVAGQDAPYFRTSEFSDVVLRCERAMLDLLHAPDGSRCVFLTASGTGAMEAVVMDVLRLVNVWPWSTAAASVSVSWIFAACTAMRLTRCVLISVSKSRARCWNPVWGFGYRFARQYARDVFRLAVRYAPDLRFLQVTRHNSPR